MFDALNRIPIRRCVLHWYVTCYVCVIWICRFSSFFFFVILRFWFGILFQSERNRWMFLICRIRHFSRTFVTYRKVLPGSVLGGRGGGAVVMFMITMYNIWSRLCTKFHKCADVISILLCHSKKFYIHFESASPLTNVSMSVPKPSFTKLLELFHHPQNHDNEHFLQ